MTGLFFFFRCFVSNFWEDSIDAPGVIERASDQASFQPEKADHSQQIYGKSLLCKSCTIQALHIYTG